MEQFISKEILDELSYTSTLGQSLKQISLSQTPLEKIIQDIGKYRANYVDILIQENLIGSRFKSDDSIYRKYQRDNLAYPIEIQLWCGDDFKFNVWSHRYIYKYDTAEIGRMMYQSYKAGMIQNEEEFVEQLKKLRGE